MAFAGAMFELAHNEQLALGCELRGRRIQFDTLQTSLQVKTTRLVAPKLVEYVCQLLDMQRGPFRQAIDMITASFRRLVEPGHYPCPESIPTWKACGHHTETVSRDAELTALFTSG